MVTFHQTLVMSQICDGFRESSFPRLPWDSFRRMHKADVAQAVCLVLELELSQQQPVLKTRLNVAVCEGVYFGNVALCVCVCVKEYV